jgi:hypothetical protein
MDKGRWSPRALSEDKRSSWKAQLETPYSFHGGAHGRKNSKPRAEAPGTCRRDSRRSVIRRDDLFRFYGLMGR